MDHPADRDHREPPVHDLDELETRSLPADLEGVETDVPGLVFGGVNGILTVLKRCVFNGFKTVF